MDFAGKGVTAARKYGETTAAGFQIRARVAAIADQLKKSEEEALARRELMGRLGSLVSTIGRNTERTKIMKAGAEELGVEYKSSGLLENIGLSAPDMDTSYGGYSAYGLLDVGRSRLYDPTSLAQAIERAKMYWIGR